MPLAHAQGETVNLSYLGTLSNSSSTALGVYDQNQNARAIQPYERLIIDTISLATTDTGGVICYILALAAGASAATQATLVGALEGTGENNTLDFSDKEGVGIAAGITPSALLSGASTFNYAITGTGRIVQADYQGQKSWQCSPARGVFA